ncbi:TraB/VirB10 family protein [Acidovorax sp. LjRoot129]|uniref:TrbI/VirB10 family protein n=1 Tax=unclassified Acidovorax TaxID=2684926 RepID=UPI003ED10BC0
MSITEKLNNLQPKTRRLVLGGGAIVLVFGVSFLLTNMTEKKASRTPRAAKPEVTVVTPQRVTGVEQFGARMDTMTKVQEEMRAEFEKRFKNFDEKKGNPEGLPTDTAAASRPAEPVVPALEANTSVFDAPASRAPALPPPPPMAAPMPMPAATTSAPTANEATSSMAETSVGPTIRLLSEGGEMDEQKAEQRLNTLPASANSRKKRENEAAYIPGGSMFPGVLLNGMDAPTSSVSQKNPTPVLIRVKKEAVLPNFASIDVRECFVMGAGFGQLASERALIRTESIACVRHDGKVFDTKMEAYIVGTDGKVGVPGRLVSKQGQMIAQSLLAGALGGIGQALTKSRVPTLNIDPTQGNNIYESESLASVGQSGLAGGISSSTNMIARFYLDMAKETFPVVETQAGQVVTVIVTRGMSLPLKGSTSLERYVDAPAKPGSSAARGSSHDNDDEDQVAAPKAQANAQSMANKIAAGASAANQVGATAQPATVVGAHQVPVAIPGVNGPAPKGSGSNKPQW